MSQKYGRFTAPAKRQPPTNFGDLSVIILSAAPSKKMRGNTSRSLIELKTGTLIEHQYHTVRSVFPGCEIILVCGSDWGKVREICPADVRIVINPLWESTNVVYSILLGMVSIINRRVLIVYGDLLFNTEFIRADLSKSYLYLSNDCQNDVGVIKNHDKVENLAFGLNPRWAQSLYLTGNELKLMCQILRNENTDKLLGHELINMIIDRGGVFGVVNNDNGQLLEVDSYKNLNTAREYDKN